MTRFRRGTSYGNKLPTRCIDGHNFLYPFESTSPNFPLARKILPFSYSQFQIKSSSPKTTQEKVALYVNKSRKKQEPLKLSNIIREGLKKIKEGGSLSPLWAYELAHEVAKMDGVFVTKETVARLAWGSGRHLFIRESLSSMPSLERCDALDRLIVRFQMESLADEPELGYVKLIEQVKSKLDAASDLFKAYPFETLRSFLAPLLATRLAPYSSIEKGLGAKKRQTIVDVITEQMNKNKEAFAKDPLGSSEELSRRLVFLYSLAANLPEKHVEKQLEAAVQYVFSLMTSAFIPHSPVLKQSAYEFINDEIAILKHQRKTNPVKQVLKTLMELFCAARKLPKLSSDEQADLEIYVWKVINDQVDLLKDIPLKHKKLLQKELDRTLIDHKRASFNKLIHITLARCQEIKSLTLLSHDRDQKLYYWAVQNDLLSDLIDIEGDHLLFRFVKKRLKVFLQRSDDLESFIVNCASSYHKHYPYLDYEALHRYVTIYVKYFWYSIKPSHESNVDRYQKYKACTKSTLDSEATPLLPLI